MASVQERLKVRRRSLKLDRLTYTVLSPRPSVASRFATNQHHDKWHVLTDAEGAHLLGRLCWAMAYQQRPHTVMVIDPSVLVPNPFDADPSKPIVIVNSDIGPFGREAATALTAALPFVGDSEGTVVLQTRGLDVALSDPVAFRGRDDQAAWRNDHHKKEWIDGDAPLVIIAAPPPVLREWGVELAGLENRSQQGSSWSYLEQADHEGEVQVLDDFRSQVEHATALRRLLYPDRERQRLADDERQQMWTIGKSRQHR
jgi:hypothetical protein